jgi:hypothetical protein
MSSGHGDGFEWGMLAGKMSAMRWVLGEDWDSTLDTSKPLPNARVLRARAI